MECKTDIKFNYYYGHEAEQFSFYRIPKLLIKDKRFSGISSDAKMLYGLMLDRMQLSVKNEWIDDENRVYIIYTVEQIMEDLCCCKEKAIKILSELSSQKGIGLIDKVRRGLGKPDIIYVKNFVLAEEEKDESDVNSEVGKSNPINTNINYTDMNYNNHNEIYPESASTTTLTTEGEGYVEDDNFVARYILSPLGVDENGIRAILRTAGNDVKRCEKAVKLLKNQKGQPYEDLPRIGLQHHRNDPQSLLYPFRRSRLPQDARREQL